VSMSDTTQSQHCGRCGAPLSGCGPDGLCAVCLLESALEEPDVQSGDPFKPAQLFAFGDYEIVEEIARGGMGVVYRARQISLNRTVAIKMILGGHLANPAEMNRFRAEAETAAQLQHPNIVAIHEVGEQVGQPYFSMDLVEGRNLAQLVRDEPLPSRKAAVYLKTIAEAVQYAHSRGVLHRDLKPSNILIDENDQPRITDFGLAKRLNDSRLSTNEPQLTQTGQVLGSPSFIPPEQAAGRKAAIGPASDIYSLGAILYHLLTARPPFVAESLTQTLRMVAETEPVSPRLLNASVTRDLETICLKCLEKDPARRYPAAGELAEELARFLRGDPISARAIGATGKLWRWCRRRPAIAALILALHLVGVAGLSGIVWQWKRAESEADIARKNAEIAQVQQRLASQQELLARRRFYAAQMNLAGQAWDSGQVPRTLELLETQQPAPGQRDLRSFEWLHLWGLCHERLRFELRGHQEAVKSVAFSPDGGTLASSGDDGVIRLWNTATGQERIAVKVAPSLPRISALVFTRDGKTLVSGSWDTHVRLFDAASGQLRATYSGHPSMVRCLAVSPDGKTLASGGDGGVVRLWDLRTGGELSTLKAHRGTVMALAFSSDNQMLATGSGWDEPEGGLVVLWRLSEKPSPVWKSPIQVVSLAFSPDNRTLAAPVWDNIQLMDTSNGQSRGTLIGHLPTVQSIAFLPDGKNLVSCGTDRTIRLWSMDGAKESHAESRIVGAHLAPAICLAVAEDGKSLASGANDGTVKLWDLAEVQPPLSSTFQCQDLSTSYTKLLSLLPSPRSNLVFAITANGAEVHDLVTTRRLNTWPSATGLGALSPDGLLLATGEKNAVKLWEAETGRPLGSVQIHTNPLSFSQNKLSALGFSPDGRILATADFEGEAGVDFWDTQASLKHIRTLLSPGFGVSALGFSPDGKRLAVAIRHATLRFYDVSTGTLTRTIRTGNGATEVVAAIFSPDSRLLATCGEEDPKIWDVESGRQLLTLRGHMATVNGIVFSPDGGTVASCSDDSTLRLWDVTTGQERIGFKMDRPVKTVTFSRDGHALLGSNYDGTVWLRRTPEKESMERLNDLSAAER
jgi:eukaryotic-like serine/threonine-protein kinase